MSTDTHPDLSNRIEEQIRNEDERNRLQDIESRRRANQREQTQRSIDFAAQLQDETVAVRLKKTHLSKTKTLNKQQREQQAQTFHAEAEMLTGSKRLFRKHNQHLKAISSVLTAATKDFESITVDYPEDTIRLLKRDRIDELESKLTSRVDELLNAIAAAESVYQTEILPEAQERLGDLHDNSDYPPTLEGQWSIDWDYPSVQPDERLARLNPQLYEQERQRVAARFEEALRLQEQAFVEQLQSIVAGLVERLSPQEVEVYRYTGPSYKECQESRQHLMAERTRYEANDEQIASDIEGIFNEISILEQCELLAVATIIERRGDKWLRETEHGKKTKTDRWLVTEDQFEKYVTDHHLELVRRKQELKSFRDTTVTHLSEFFERFRQLNIGSNEDLDRLVDDCKQAVQGVDAAYLRKTEQQERDALRNPLAEIGDRLEALMVTKPKRAIRLED